MTGEGIEGWACGNLSLLKSEKVEAFCIIDIFSMFR